MRSTVLLRQNLASVYINTSIAYNVWTTAILLDFGHLREKIVMCAYTKNNSSHSAGIICVGFDRLKPFLGSHTRF